MKRWLLLFLSVWTFALVSAQQGMFVYRNGGLHEMFKTSEIDSIRFTPYDLTGKEHLSPVTQEICTHDSVFRIPVQEIDSISFQYPDPTFVKTEGSLNTLTQEGFRYLVWDYKTHPKQLVFRGERPVIVDYWAIWCKYCREMMPLMAQLAQEYKGKVDFYKVDTDAEVELSNVLGISSLPCIYFYPKKGQPEIRVGAMDLASMREIIEKVLLVTDDENPDAVKPEISLELWKGDERHEWTDRKVTAQIKCTTANAVMVKYGCFVKQEVESSQMTDRELIQRYGEVLPEAQLPKVNSSAGMPVSFRAHKNTEYLFLCMIKNADGGVAVQRAEVKTDANFIPSLEFEAVRGAIAERMEKGMHISIALKSRDAVSASYTCLLKDDYEAQLAAGETLETLVEKQGRKLDEQQLAAANAYGFSDVFRGLLPSSTYVCLAAMTNNQGKVSVALQEVDTPYDGYNEVIPSPDVILVAGLSGTAVTGSVNCSTCDANYASMLLIPSDELSQWLGKGKTLEEVMASHPKVSVFSDQQIEWVNGQGVSNVISGLLPSTRYTWVTEVRGRFGGRVVKRAEVQALAEGETVPAIDVTLNASYSQGVVTVSASCLSRNASSAVTAFVESAVLEKMLASGKTLEDVMDHPSKELISYDKLTTEQLGWLNDSGYITGNTETKAQTRYTWIIDVRSMDGKRVVKRSEVLTPQK